MYQTWASADMLSSFRGVGAPQSGHGRTGMGGAGRHPTSVWPWVVRGQRFVDVAFHVEPRLCPRPSRHLTRDYGRVVVVLEDGDVLPPGPRPLFREGPADEIAGVNLGDCYVPRLTTVVQVCGHLRRSH